VGSESLQQRRDRALGSGAELFYDTPLKIANSKNKAHVARFEQVSGTE
jgi:hypothetical protein